MSADTDSSESLPSSTVQRLEEPPTHEMSDSRSQYLYHDVDHPLSSFSEMNKMRVNNQLCDVSLRVSDNVIRAHRLVLSSSSPYFFTMFNGKLAEPLQFNIEIQDLDFDALQLLVIYAYTGLVHITMDNVRELLHASSFLQINSVLDACCTFLWKQLNPKNCLVIKQMAETFSCDDLRARSYRYALQNFEEVANTEDFLLLPYSVIEDLVSDYKLNTTSEDQVFKAVMDWVKHSPAERSRHVAQLLGHVRLAQMSTMFLMNVVKTEPLMRVESRCFDQWLVAVTYHMFPDQKTVYTTKQTEKRSPDGPTPYIFVFGSSYTNIQVRDPLYPYEYYNTSRELITSQCYNPWNCCWLPMSPLPQNNYHAGVATLGGQIYTIGGLRNDVGTTLGSAGRYDPDLNKWSDVTSLGTKRSRPGVGAVHGLLYACGGHDGTSSLGTVERYDPLTGIWSTCPGLISCRGHCRISVVNNCLYAIGGKDPTKYLQSIVERYDPRTSNWTILPAVMSNPRRDSAVATLDGMLYSVGGFDGTAVISSGERLNVRQNTWEPVADMQCPRTDHGMVELDGELMVLGGYDGKHNLGSTERYDSRTNLWTKSTPTTKKYRSVRTALLYCTGFKQNA